MQTKAKIKKVYINYSMNDYYLANPFVELLSKMDECHKLYYTQSNTHDHRTLNQLHLVNQVETLYLADYFIVFWSKNSVNDVRIRENCQKTNRPIILILLDKTPIPKRLSNYKVIDLIPFTEKNNESRNQKKKKYFVHFPIMSIVILILLFLTLPIIAIPFIAMAMVLTAILVFVSYLMQLFSFLDELSAFTTFEDIEYFMTCFYAILFPDIVDNNEIRHLLYELNDGLIENMYKY